MTPQAKTFSANKESLGALIAQAQVEASAMVKDKTSDMGRYKFSYTTKEAAFSFIRDHLSKQGVAFSVSYFDASVNAISDEGHFLALVQVVVELVLGEEREVWSGCGSAIDKGDKALAKAQTSGLRVLLVNNLLGTDGTRIPEESDGDIVAKAKPKVKPDPNVDQVKKRVVDLARRLNVVSPGSAGRDLQIALCHYGNLKKFSDLQKIENLKAIREHLEADEATAIELAMMPTEGDIANEPEVRVPVGAGEDVQL